MGGGGRDLYVYSPLRGSAQAVVMCNSGS